MLDPVRLRKFKKQTREDELVAEVICSLVDLRSARSILEVGAGPGMIGRVLAGGAMSGCQLDVIEPNEQFQYPKNVRAIRTDWEHTVLDRQYDLIVMSHVIGHFVREGRAKEVLRALESLSDSGRLVVVENAPTEPYWSLNLEIAKIQSDQYVIDFEELESAFQERGVQWTKEDRVIRLWMGATTPEMIETINIFFPWEFTAKEESRIVEWFPRIMPKHDGVLDLTQRFYVVNRS